MILIKNKKGSFGLYKLNSIIISLLSLLLLQACSEPPQGSQGGSAELKLTNTNEAAAEEAGHDEENEEAQVELDSAARDLIPIVVEELYPQVLPITISAPGEVRFNEYKSAVVSPLIDVTVVERRS